MQGYKQLELVPFPNGDIQDNIEFETIASAGTFTFKFKWLNNRWNLWVTLPDGTVREAGVQPNVISWSGFRDFGLIFNTQLQLIDYSSLFLTEMYLITWQ